MSAPTPASVFSAPIEPQGLALSPDGTQVAMLYLREAQPLLGLFEVSTGRPLRELALPCGRPGGLVWSPDGARLAFYAGSRETTDSDVFAMDLASAEVRNLTPHLHRYAFVPSWSPESDCLAFSAYTPPSGTDRPQVFTVDLAGNVRQWTSDDVGNARPQFLPSGTAVVHLHALRDDCLNLLDLTAGLSRPLTAAMGNSLHRGCCSPDGSRLVVTEHRAAEISVVAVISVATGEVTELTAEDRSFERAAWSPSGAYLSVLRDRERLLLFSPAGEVREAIALPTGDFRAGFSTAPVWAARTDLLAAMDQQGNVWVGGPGLAFRQVTHFPASAPFPYAFEEVRYPSTDGAQVPGLLIAPPEGPSGRAIVWVHGGPWGTSPHDTVTLPLNRRYVEALIAGGITVLAPDYRGSSGHGTEWEYVAEEQRGLVDVDDVAAGARYLVAQGLARADSVAVAGHSYGGYLVLLSLARHPGTFACGITLWSVLDLDHQRSAFGEAIPEDRRAWQSPLRVLDDIRDPLLILHGAQDTTGTIAEVHHIRDTLTHLGRVCEATIFPGDTHGLPMHGREAAELLVSFCRRHTGT